MNLQGLLSSVLVLILCTEEASAAMFGKVVAGLQTAGAVANAANQIQQKQQQQPGQAPQPNLLSNLGTAATVLNAANGLANGAGMPSPGQPQTFQQQQQPGIMNPQQQVYQQPQQSLYPMYQQPQQQIYQQPINR